MSKRRSNTNHLRIHTSRVSPYEFREQIPSIHCISRNKTRLRSRTENNRFRVLWLAENLRHILRKTRLETVARARHAQKANAGNISGTFLSAPVHPYRSLYTLLFRVRTRRAFIRHACTRVQSTVAICICERCMLMTFEEPRLPAAPPPFWIIPGLHRVCLIAARVRSLVQIRASSSFAVSYAEEFFLTILKFNWKIDLCIFSRCILFFWTKF